MDRPVWLEWLETAAAIVAGLLLFFGLAALGGALSLVCTKTETVEAEAVVTAWHCEDLSVEDAAHRGLWYARSTQPSMLHEFGGFVFSTKSEPTRFCITEPMTSGEQYYVLIMALMPPDAVIEAIYHTHVGTDDMAGMFSHVDVEAACVRGVPSYILTGNLDIFAFWPMPHRCDNVRPHHATSGLYRGTLLVE